MGDNAVLILSLVTTIFLVLVVVISLVTALVIKEDQQDIKRDMKSG